ncbi:hypothetical protein ACIRG5_47425 [Lentzea sp. NPDC102401]|uniref:lipase/acyltransferase domain-containing protein n=1 Tax=Lentzea sp. NPDC102401 TaxID=3364128 RepID=UPI003813E23E
MHDAVIVVPGIMGSTLEDINTGKTLWGVGELFKYTARMHADRLRSLAVTEEERSGQLARVKATGLLNIADWLPGLGGMQPYGQIVRRMRQNALHKDAVSTFPYDWRLSVAHNGVLLRRAARAHLDAWRSHHAHQEHRARNPESGPARLLFVAHSMGGLLVRELLRFEDVRDDIRAVLTAGTPFHGSVKAAVMLNSGVGAPVPVDPDLLRAVAPTMPGLYDLLPSYRSLDDGTDMRAPDLQDIVALGGNADLAQASLDWRRQRLSGFSLPGHSMVLGYGHRTLQSYRMTSSGAVGQEYVYMRDGGRVLKKQDGSPRREDRRGDGTVYQFAAHDRGSDAKPIEIRQEHGALVRSSTVVELAAGMLRGLSHPSQLPDMLGEGEIGLEVPEWAPLGGPFDITVTGWDGDALPTCVLREVGSGAVRPVILRPGDGTATAECLLHEPGLYEVEVTGGREPAYRLVLVVER